MTKTISIQGETFEVTAPYSEGAVINAAEAKSLNQSRAENIGNNFRAAVKDALAKPEGAERAAAVAKVKADFAAYDATYVFTLGGTTRTPIDPIEAEAIRIAKEAVGDQIRKAKGLSVKDYLAIEGNQARYDAALEATATSDRVLALAKQRVNAKKKALAEVGELDLG